MNRAFIILTLIILTIIPLTYAANDFAYNRLYDGTQPIDGFNYSINVNNSDNWITNIGVLSGVNATQFDAIANVLNIDTSWLGGFVDGNFNSTAWSRSGTDVFLTNAGDNVGIGTTNPTRKLSIESSGHTTTPMFQLKETSLSVDDDVALSFNRDNTDTLGWTMGILSSDNSFIIAEDGDSLNTRQSFIIQADNDVIIPLGDVGIGLANPNLPLHVFNSTLNNVARFESGDDTIGIALRDDDGTRYVVASSNEGAISIGVDNFVSSNNLVIQDDGNVGIGTTSPDVPLHVITTGSNSRFESEGAGNSIVSIKNTEGEFELRVNNGGFNLYDQGDDVERLSIDTDGNVGIGTSTPNFKLDVNGSANIDGNLTMNGDLDMGGNDIFNVDMVNATGSIFADAFVVTNGSSIFFGNNTINFTAKMSATSVSLINRSRSTVIVDSDFGAVTSKNDTLIFASVNLNPGEIAGSAISTINNIGNSIALFKPSTNFPDTQSYLVGKGNDLVIMNQNESIRIGFFTRQIIDPLSTTTGFEGRFDVMEISNESIVSINGTLNITENLTVGDKITFKLGEMIDNLVDGWLRITGNLNVTGDLNVNGNITGNQIYGGMGINDETGIIVNLITVNIYENITGFNSTRLNGFTSSNNESLIAQVSGVYEVTYDISFADTANSQLGFNVGVNGIPDSFTHSDRKIGTGGDVGNTGGSGIIELNIGDGVTLMARDENAPVSDITISASNFKIIRIGNL